MPEMKARFVLITEWRMVSGEEFREQPCCHERSENKKRCHHGALPSSRYAAAL